jgi:hypothetical protein
MRMSAMGLSAICGLLLAAQSSCISGNPVPPDEGQVGADPEPAPDPGPESSCPTDELAFTKGTGCQNDGSVEFCLPSGDDELLARVKEIAPTIQALPSQGRADCDVPAETLYLFPTGEAECVSRHGALEDAAWDTLCRIAALPEVRKIVPTFYE